MSNASKPSEEKRGPHRYQKGQSGNPSGQSKAVREFNAEFHGWLKEKAYPQAQAALLRCLQSDDGKVQMAAVKEVHERLFGRAPQPVTDGEGRPIGVIILPAETE